MLDNLPWHALNTEHARLALSAPGARKYPADVAPFGGTSDNSCESLEQLALLLEPEETVYVVRDDPLRVSGAAVRERFTALQMLANDGASRQADSLAVRLSAEDAGAMVA